MLQSFTPVAVDAFHALYELRHADKMPTGKYAQRRDTVAEQWMAEEMHLAESAWIGMDVGDAMPVRTQMPA